MRTIMSEHAENKVELYLLSGLATAPLFMEDLRLALERRLRYAALPGQAGAVGGAEIRSCLLYPYGDWSRNVLAQLWEIRADMRRREGKLDRSIGGGRALAEIRRERGKADIAGTVGTTLLVGHSGGGIAAVHAAATLMASGASASCFAVKIGSPRCRIPERLKHRVLSIHAEGRRKGDSFRRSPDIVSRIGSYGGWGINRSLPVWRKDKHAPASWIGVPIVGKHPDYFRNRPPYFNADGKSNLDLIVEAIAAWLSALK